MLAVAKDHHVATTVGKNGTHKAGAIAARLPKRVWARHSAGSDAKGQRLYDWALVDIHHTTANDTTANDTTCKRILLIRRSIRTGELAFYAATCPPRSRWPPSSVSPAAADRRGIVPNRQRTRRPRRASGPPLDLMAQLDHPRHPRARLPDRNGHAYTTRNPFTTSAYRSDRERNPPPVTQLTDHTRHGIKHRMHLLHWSHWRRRHQARSQHCHYRRQATRLE